LNANQRVMRSLACFNNFLIRSETNLTTARAWHNHQLRLKGLDILQGFNFINRLIIIEQWLRRINNEWTSWLDEELERSWQPRSKNMRFSSTSSWFDELCKGVDEKQGFSPSTLLEMTDDRLDEFSEEDVSSPQCNDRLTSNMSYAQLEEGTSWNDFS